MVTLARWLKAHRLAGDISVGLALFHPPHICEDTTTQAEVEGTAVMFVFSTIATPVEQPNSVLFISSVYSTHTASISVTKQL